MYKRQEHARSCRQFLSDVAPGQRLASGQNVIVHRRLRARRVAGLDRRQDGRVFDEMCIRDRVMVPTLTMMFAAQAGFPPNEVLHLALGTSMATILFTSLASLRAHHQHGAVLWKIVFQITPGILLGTLLGTFFAGSVPSRPLALFFTVFVCLVAAQMILNLKPKAARELPGFGGVFAVGSGIGAVSALVAIGGGSLTVPFLTWCNVRVQHAIGTSAAIGFPIAFGGSLGYIFNGWGHADLPPWSLGYVHLPAFAWLVPSLSLIHI